MRTTDVMGRANKMKLALVCSHGGHLTQMMMLRNVFEEYDHFVVTHPCARTETLSSRKNVYLLPNVIGVKVWPLTLVLFRSLWILLKERPDIIISTGATLAVPFCWLGKLLGARAVYIESWCRTHSRTVTGRLVYPVVDLFLVQWPTMVGKYGPKACYEGSVV